MKKYIWLLLAVFMMVLVACSKTAMNSSKIIGSWRVVRQEWLYNDKTDPVPYDASLDIVVEFQQDGKLMYTDMNGNPNYHFAGEWTIKGDNLTLKFYAPAKNIYSGKYVITSLYRKSMGIVYLSGDSPSVDSPLGIFLEKV